MTFIMTPTASAAGARRVVRSVLVLTIPKPSAGGPLIFQLTKMLENMRRKTKVIKNAAFGDVYIGEVKKTMSMPMNSYNFVLCKLYLGFCICAEQGTLAGGEAASLPVDFTLPALVPPVVFLGQLTSTI